MIYHFKVHRENDGYWAECIELKGCLTQGQTMKELEDNMREVLELFLNEPEDSDMTHCLPDPSLKKRRNVIGIAVGPAVGMSVLLRHLRAKHKLTQKEVAKKMGFKSIFAYQKLESPRTCNPGLDTLLKLKKVFRDLNVDLVLDVI